MLAKYLRFAVHSPKIQILATFEKQRDILVSCLVSYKLTMLGPQMIYVLRAKKTVFKRVGVG